MKKIIYFLSFIIMLQLMPLNYTKAEENIIQIHVSVRGSDGGDGSLQNPLKSIEAAKKEVKKIKSGVKTEVIFHEGEYRITKQVLFDETDSGTETAPVTYKAAEGENVVFKGSVLLDVSKFEPVSDENIYKRLPDESAEHVGELSLSKQGIRSAVPIGYGNYTTDPVNSNQLYLNGAEQTLARWPNAGYSTDFETISSTDAIFAAPSRVANWKSADDIRIGGFPCIDYAYDRARVSKIDLGDNSITLNKVDLFGNIGVSGRRWFAYNLLEELDMPGEWYIDKDTNMLYYYPMQPLTETSLEMSVLTDAMLYFKNCAYINFEGISVRQTCGDAIFLETCSDLSFSGMNFSDIGRSAFGADKYVPSHVNKNITVDKCNFNNIGSTAVTAFAGNADTLEPGNYVVKNSLFNNLSRFRLAYAPGVDMSGAGNSVFNCTMSGSAAQMIVIKGSEHTVMYNEFFDSCRELNDTGVIYSFGNAAYRGNEVAYNYIHDYIQPENTAGLLCGVYLDNGISGWSVHHNIIKNMPRGVFVNGGQDNNIYNNIIVESPKGIQFGTCANNKTYDAAIYKKALEYAKENPIYFEKYSEMKKIDLENTTLRNNTVTGNLLVNSSGNVFEDNDFIKWSGKGTDNKKSNNVISDSLADFEDAENGIYSLRADSTILNKIPELADIRTEKMGVKQTETLYDEFAKVYPYNGQQNVSEKELILTWTYPRYADRFHVTVSTDSKMQNIVFEGDSIKNYIKPKNIKTGKNKYYWQVDAYHGSDLINSYRPDNGMPYMFVTSLYDTLDKSRLNKNIYKAKETLSGLIEGDNPGECEIGAIELLKKAIDSAVETSKLKYGDQKLVEDENDKLKKAVNTVSVKINKGYSGLDDLLDSPDNWETNKSDSTTVADGKIILSSGSNRVGTISDIKNYYIYKYRMNIGLNDNGGAGIALRQSSFADSWDSGIKSYLIIIKKDIIELHVYNAQERGIVRTVANKYIEPGEWFDIETGAIDVDGGVQILVRINGTVLFNYLDTTRNDASGGIMQFSNLGCDYVEVGESSEIPKLDENIIRKSKAEKEVPKEIQLSELVGENMYDSNNGTTIFKDSILELKGNGENNSFVLKKKLSDAEICNVNVMLVPGADGQSFCLCADNDALGNSNSYKFNVTNDFVELKRNSVQGDIILCRVPNKYFYEGKWTSVIFGAYYTGNGTRIMLYADGYKVIDCIDAHKFAEIRYLKFYDNSLKGIKLK